MKGEVYDVGKRGILMDTGSRAFSRCTAMMDPQPRITHGPGVEENGQTMKGLVPGRLRTAWEKIV